MNPTPGRDYRGPAVQPSRVHLRNGRYYRDGKTTEGSGRATSLLHSAPCQLYGGQ